MTAQIWFTKTVGWSETSILKHSEETQFDRMSEEELIRSIAHRANKLGIKIDHRGGNCGSKKRTRRSLG